MSGLGVSWVEITLAENYEVQWFDKEWQDLPRVQFGRVGPSRKMKYDKIRFSENDVFMGFHATWTDWSKFSIN